MTDARKAYREAMDKLMDEWDRVYKLIVAKEEATGEIDEDLERILETIDMEITMLNEAF